MYKEKLALFEVYFALDPEAPSGVKWKTAHGPFGCVGRPAGSRNTKGYYSVKLNGKQYKCHQIVLLLSGVYPKKQETEVDHINRNPADNSLSNLRWVTHSSNCKNRKTVGKVAHKYVTKRPDGRFQARYNCHKTKRKIHVGTYDDAYEAHCQALAHRLENHWITQ
jgi:HNH endonuclease